VLDSLFHEDAPSDRRTNRPRISAQDRERCIIAILASRGNVRNLAVHIYVALMLNVTPEEIADIIFLAGVYSGVPAVADGLDTQIKTLQALENVANARGNPDINAVFAELSKLPL
jgi:alkylhydroperoxidase/carboxymuconolactone decarboxylase family protein YurZ